MFCGMSNRLALEPSLYLRQHAENPVDWWPWGEEAFAEAARRGVPVLVSIGYSACHWCHVMAHECFEDAYIGRLMNQHYVCIKVDREERPDVDQLYMEAVMMLNGHGGWPLNVFCLPDKRPFFGGTYFPPSDSGRGIVPWPQLLMRISEYWQRSREDLLENAEAITKNLAHANQPGGMEDGWNAAVLLEAADLVEHHHDDECGGFGDAPKFPQPMTLRFLLSLRGTAACERRGKLGARLDAVVVRSLYALARGGIFDQVGGGFARYSVDRRWVVPHFEKMLYDNGQLLGLFAVAYQAYPEPLFAAVAEEVVGWLEREMRLPTGLYAAALDADSPGGEGRFYCWTPGEVAEVLPAEEAARFCRVYGITENGNFEHGWTIPTLQASQPEVRAELAEARARLLAAREPRGRPQRDDKAVLAWNALALRGLAEAAVAMNRADWFTRARGLAEALLSTFRRADGTWASVAYPGTAPRGTATLDDAAFLAEALLTLLEGGHWLTPEEAAHYQREAADLVAWIGAAFRDPHQAGYFFAAVGRTDLAVRKKEWTDNALPGGMSSLVHVLSRLYALTGEAAYAEELATLRPAWTGYARRAPTAVAHALDGLTRDATGIVVVKASAESLGELRHELRVRHPRPVLLLPQSELGSTQPPSEATPAGNLAASAGAEATSGAFQVCIGTTCLPPIASAIEAAEVIAPPLPE